MWCWGRMEKTIWANRVRNEEVMQSRWGKEYRKYYKTKEDNWIGHILLRNCLLKYVTEG